MDGLLIINKEANMTSRDVVNIVCKKLNTKKVGHTGTLDPLAAGVLVVAVGKALKIVEEITSLEKEYIAKVTLGVETDTLDITGNVLRESNDFNIEEKDIIRVLNSFKGSYEMEVPKYSAIKVNGKKLYEYARNNEEVTLPKKNVYINDIELLEYDKNSFVFWCNVSKGTYIRSLIRDICKKLNVLGTMSELTRTKQGIFDIEDAVLVDDINSNSKLISMKDALDLPKIEVDEFLYNKIKNGQKLEDKYGQDKLCFIYKDELIAIYVKDIKDESKIKPKKVFITN